MAIAAAAAVASAAATAEASMEAKRRLIECDARSSSFERAAKLRMANRSGVAMEEANLFLARRAYATAVAGPRACEVPKVQFLAVVARTRSRVTRAVRDTARMTMRLVECIATANEPETLLGK